MGKCGDVIFSAFFSDSTQKRGELMRCFDIDVDECRDVPEILTPNEVADYLCIHINMVYKLIHRRILPAFRVGKSWRIHRADLLALAAGVKSELGSISQKEKAR